MISLDWATVYIAVLASHKSSGLRKASQPFVALYVPALFRSSTDLTGASGILRSFPPWALDSTPLPLSLSLFRPTLGLHSSNSGRFVGQLLAISYFSFGLLLLSSEKRELSIFRSRNRLILSDSLHR